MAEIATERTRLRDDLLARGVAVYSTDEDPRGAVCAACAGAQWVRVAALTGGTTGVELGFDPARAQASIEAAIGRLAPCPACTVPPPMGWRVEFSGLPHRQRVWTFGAFTPQPGKGPALAAVERWVQGVLAQPRGAPSLLVGGGPGVGKSHLASAAVLALCRAGIGVRYEYVPALLDRTRSQNSAAVTEDDWPALLAVPVLVLDDLVADRITPWAEGRLTVLLHMRLHEGRPTLISTDVSPDQMADALGHRIASRLREYQRVAVGGADMRGKA